MLRTKQEVTKCALTEAHWRSTAKEDDTIQQTYDRKTFEILLALSNVPETEISIVPGIELYKRKPKDWKDPWFSKFVPDYAYYQQDGFEFGICYKTVCINPPAYLSWLHSEYKKLVSSILILGRTRNHQNC